VKRQMIRLNGQIDPVTVGQAAEMIVKEAVSVCGKHVTSVYR